MRDEEAPHAKTTATSELEAPVESHAKAPTVHLNLNVRGLSPSATLAINERSALLIQGGRRIFKLGLGQSPFPVPEPVVESLRQNAHRKEYLEVKGLAALRAAVAEYHRRAHGVDRHGENVLIGPGSKELMFLLQMVYYGDLVIPTPAWVSYAPQASIIGRHVRWISTSAANCWKLQPGELEQLCRDDPGRPRIVILNDPNNPTGQTYEAAELRALADVARRYRVVVLSDEIYGETHHEGKHVSMAEFYPEGTIISTGLSKWCGAGGWRLGTFTFPDHLKWLLDAMAVVASETYTATSAPIQFAATTAFDGCPAIDEYLEHCRRILRALGRFCAAQLSEANLRWRPRAARSTSSQISSPFAPRSGIVASSPVRSSVNGCWTRPVSPRFPAPAVAGRQASSHSEWPMWTSTARRRWSPRGPVRTTMTSTKRSYGAIARPSPRPWIA